MPHSWQAGWGDGCSWNWLASHYFRAVFTWVSKVICVYFGFALLRFVIGLKNSRHFLNQSEVKPKPNTSKTKTNRNLLRVLIGQWITLRPLWLAKVITQWLLWFWFYDTQLIFFVFGTKCINLNIQDQSPSLRLVVVACLYINMLGSNQYCSGEGEEDEIPWMHSIQSFLNKSGRGRDFLSLFFLGKSIVSACRVGEE